MKPRYRIVWLRRYMVCPGLLYAHIVAPIDLIPCFDFYNHLKEGRARLFMHQIPEQCQ